MIVSATVKQVGSFYMPWMLAAAAAAHVDQGPEGVFVEVHGITVPVLRLTLAVAGVLMARPLAPRREPPLGLSKSILVTAIMLLVAATWVVEAVPGFLFTFVVAIGLGFSGYTLIEIAGREIEAFVKRAFAAATAAIDNLTGTKK